MSTSGARQRVPSDGPGSGMNAAPAEPSPGPPAVDRPIAELIAHERVNELYRMAPRALVAGLVYCPFFVWAMTVKEPFAAAWVWLAVRTALGLLRLGDVALHLRAQPGPDHSSAWRRRGLAMLAVDAAGWAAIAPLFLNHRQGLEQALVLATLIAVAAIAIIAEQFLRALVRRSERYRTA